MIQERKAVRVAVFIASVLGLASLGGSAGHLFAVGLVLCVVALALTGILVWWHRRTLKRLVELERFLSEVREHRCFERRLSIEDRAIPRGAAGGVERIMVLVNGLFATVEENNRKIQARDRETFLSQKMFTLGTLASGVAHEISNPLTAIIGTNTLIRRRLEKEGKLEAFAELLENQKESASRITTIVQSLSLYARQDETTMSGDFDLNEVIEDTIRLVDRLYQRAAVRLEKRFASTRPRVRGNAGKMQLVLLNMLLNARQAVRSKGQHAWIAIETEDGPRGVTVRISDNGTGIERKDMEFVFDPFFTTKAPSQGKGLGLSVAHSVVTSFGGKIDVDSVPGEGSTFRIRLPALNQPQ